MPYVQFSDASQVQVVAEFGNPQDTDEYPNQGELPEEDPRYIAFMEPKEPEVITDLLEKLKLFLLENPDVAAILK